MFAPSQWETSLQSNAISHWLGTNLESVLQLTTFKTLGYTGTLYVTIFYVSVTLVDKRDVQTFTIHDYMRSVENGR